MPLTAITIENFKGVSSPVTIPLRPITLLFGPNSAGKSTILQALQYALEVLENRNADVDRTRLGGDYIDLGGFRKLVHGHDLSLKIRIALHFSGGLKNEPYLPSAGAFVSTDTGPADESDLDITNWCDLKSMSVAIETGWDERLNHPVITRYGVGFDNTLFAETRYQPLWNPCLALDGTHPIFQSDSIRKMDFHGKILSSLDILYSGFEATRPEGTERIQQMGEENPDTWRIPLAHLTYEEPTYPEFYPEKPLDRSPIPDWDKGIRFSEEDIIEVLDSERELTENTLSQLLLGPGQAILEELRRIRYLGPLSTVPERLQFNPRRPDPSRWVNGLGAWDTLLRRGRENGTSTDTRRSSLVEQCSDYLNDTLAIGYTLRWENRIQLPENGDIMASLRLIAAQYEEREARDIQLRILAPLETLPRIPALQLRDEKNGVDVDPMDIGVGVSQVLPVVVGAVDADCSIFAVEQPELHVHPAVQSKMGDLFLQEAFNADTANRIFLLETHSEHLILRILRRIRETTDNELPPGYPEITPEDVQVLYIKSGDGGIEVCRLSWNRSEKPVS